MAPLNPPSVLDQGTYSARLDRLTMGSLWTPASAGGLSSRPGVRPTVGSSAMVVTPGSGMRVNVAAGTAVVPTPPTANGGVYECHNDGSYAVNLATSDPALNRIDRIVARVYDAEYSGVEREWHLEPVTGTPGATPEPPPLPDGCLELAQVRVNAGATSINGDNITDRRVWTVAVGGVLPIRDASGYPANPYPGQGVFRLDERQARFWDGSVWTYGKAIDNRFKGIEAVFGVDRCLVQLHGSGNDNSVAPNSTEYNTTFNTGRTEGGDFEIAGWSAERRVPRTGLWLVNYRSELRTTKRSQRNDGGIRIRRNGESKNAASGTTVAVQRHEFSEGSHLKRISLMISDIIFFRERDKIKFLVQNSTSDGYIISEGHPDYKKASMLWLGP